MKKKKKLILQRWNNYRNESRGHIPHKNYYYMDIAIITGWPSPVCTFQIKLDFSSNKFSNYTDMTSLKAGSGTLPNGPFGSSNLRHWPCLAISCCLVLESEYAFHPNARLPTYRLGRLSRTCFHFNT